MRLPPVAAHGAALGAVLAVTAAAYRAAPSCGFAFDDHLAIERNRDVDPTATPWFPNLVSHDFWGKPLTDPASNRSFRPLTIASFRLSSLLAGGLDPAHFHLENVLLHLLATALCYLASVRHSYLLGGRPAGGAASVAAAAVSALLFGVHPVHAEAVTGVVGRAELLCLVFAVPACWLLGESPPSMISLLGFTFLCLLSCLAKELGVTVVAVALVTDAALRSRRVSSPPAAGASVRCPALPCHPAKLAAGAAAGAGYLLLRKAVVGTVDLSGSGLLRRTENPILFAEGAERVLSRLYIQAKYLQLLLFPVELCCEYPYDCIPLVRNFRDPRAWAAVGVAGAAALAALLLLRGLLRRSRGAAALAPLLAWVVCPFVPASGLFATVGTMLGERLLYIPSLGWCLLCGHLGALWAAPDAEGEGAPRRGSGRLLVLAACGAATASVAAARLHDRNLEWRSDETLFESGIRVCPRGAKHYQQLGILRLNQHRHEEARGLLETAIAIDPEWCEPPLYLGKYWARMGREHYLTAQSLWRRCVTCPWVLDECFDLFHQVQQLLMDAGNATAYEEMGEVLGELELWQLSSKTYRQTGLLYNQRKQWAPAARAMSLAVDAWFRANPDGNLTATAGYKQPAAPAADGAQFSADERAARARSLRNVGEQLARQVAEAERKKPKEVLPEETNVEHPCNMWYWLGLAQREMGKLREAAATYILQLRGCTHVPRALMAAADGLQRAYGPLLQSDAARRRAGVALAEAHRGIAAASAAIARGEALPLSAADREDHWQLAAAQHARCAEAASAAAEEATGRRAARRQRAVACGCYRDAADALAHTKGGGALPGYCQLLLQEVAACAAAADSRAAAAAEARCAAACPAQLRGQCRPSAAGG
eukprot:TRINITY_DN47350_c0_g1_i1.p1 TRINITY_DN47350_c0_g1~~TRINITY_DN47350_c0_g1_i1.p1  ORF type:complete len:911 (+),score=236.58 TRINITY_DN47350_c0_g1_i1:86-2734(+)